jgi:hypothetical protein
MTDETIYRNCIELQAWRRIARKLAAQLFG